MVRNVYDKAQNDRFMANKEGLEDDTWVSKTVNATFYRCVDEVGVW